MVSNGGVNVSATKVYDKLAKLALKAKNNSCYNLRSNMQFTKQSRRENNILNHLLNQK